jgi:hypothetical protein
VTLPAAVSGGDEVGGLLAELHDHDVIRLDEHGGVRAAYPFSGVPTAHAVRTFGGPMVYAMCAMDALGMADMLGRDVNITSTNPAYGREIRVEIRGRSVVWGVHMNPTAIAQVSKLPAGRLDACSPSLAGTAAGMTGRPEDGRGADAVVDPELGGQWIGAGVVAGEGKLGRGTGRQRVGVEATVRPVCCHCFA